MPGGFFQRLADHGIEQALALVEVAGRLVEHPFTVRLFFDQQKFPVALDDGRDHDIRFPDHGVILQD